MKKDHSGLIVAITIAVIAFVISSLHSSFESLVISIIILGMLIANFFDEKDFLKRGIDLSLKYFLPVGIALCGSVH